MRRVTRGASREDVQTISGLTDIEWTSFKVRNLIQVCSWLTFPEHNPEHGSVLRRSIPEPAMEQIHGDEKDRSYQSDQ